MKNKKWLSILPPERITKELRKIIPDGEFNADEMVKMAAEWLDKEHISTSEEEAEDITDYLRRISKHEWDCRCGRHVVGWRCVCGCVLK